MSYSQRSMDFSKPADADLSAKQFYIAKVTSTGVDLAGAATNALCGVIQNTPKSGEQADIRFLGTSKVVASGSISAGAWVTADSSGKATATTTDKDFVIGQALEAAGADGDIIEIRLCLFTLSHA